MATACKITRRYEAWQASKAATFLARQALAAARRAEEDAEAAFAAMIEEGQVVIPPLITDHVWAKHQGVLTQPTAVFLGV